MSDRGIYTISFTKTGIVAATGDYELFSVIPGPGKHIEFVAFSLGNKTAIQDANEEMVNIAVVRGHTTAGTGGTVATAVPLSPSSPALGATTVRVLDGTTLATLGTPVFCYRDTFNIRAGIFMIWPPELRPEVRSPELMSLRLVDALATNEDFVGTLWVRES